MEQVVHMGKFAIAKDGEALRTTLGSCVGVILYNKDKSIYGLAHVMLPLAPHAEPAEIGKYMDTAIPALMKMMGYENNQGKDLKAKIAGGADMFSAIKKSTNVAIGQKNIDSALSVLADLKISVIAKEVGGTKGRQMVVNTAEKKIYVTQIGQSAKEL